MSFAPTLAPAYVPPGLDDLLQRLQDKAGVTPLADVAAFESFAVTPGDCLVLLVEDPVRMPEAWDLAVILPEILKSQPGAFTAAVLPPVPGRAVASRYGITVWPALLFLRDGQFVGRIEGLKDWQVYAREIPAMLQRQCSVARIQ